MYTYDTLSEAINGLRQRGFTVDFNLEDNCLICHEGKFNVEDFEIVEVYRFEGITDPGDEEVLYGIESKTGLKGILVNGYGVYSNSLSNEMARKLAVHYN
jgi:hypothetical protein